MGTEFVRVKDKTTKHEYSTPKAFAESADDLEILTGKEAIDANGRPLAAKPYVELPKAEAEAEAKRAAVTNPPADASVTGSTKATTASQTGGTSR